MPKDSPPSKSLTDGSTPALRGGAGAVAAFDYEFATSDSLQQLLLAIFESPDYRPPVFPNVALELAELTKKPNASYDDVVAVLQNDPLIVAKVLKVAQSSLYGGPLQSLQNAVQRLGINTLRDIVWQVATGMRLFQARGYTSLLERLRMHSVFTAYAARMIATRSGLAAEHAFLCGLLHDMGTCGVLIALSETGKQAPPLTALLVAVDEVHERAGATIARMWGLAPEIVGALEYHHRYDPDMRDVPVLSAVICVAESLAEQHGYGVSTPNASGSRAVRFDTQLPLRVENALKRLRLQDKKDDLTRRAQDLAQQLKALM